MSYSEEYSLGKLKEAFNILGYSPTRTDLKYLGFPTRHAYNKFGGLEEAKRIIGIPNNIAGCSHPNCHRRRKHKQGGRKKKYARCRQRFEVLHRDNFRCQYCGASPITGAVLQVDHIVPVCQGGTDDSSNFITACFECNVGKSGMALTNMPNKE